jgi:predicted nucleic acid-binding Zn ribbon protein
MKNWIKRLKASTQKKVTNCLVCGQPIQEYKEEFYIGDNMLGERAYVCSEECHAPLKKK